MNTDASNFTDGTNETHAHAERADGASARSAGAASALPRQRVTSATKAISPPLRFFTLDREWHPRLGRATQPSTVAALHEEKKARRRCLAHGYGVAYCTLDRKFFTWHLYPAKADVLAHVDYFNFVFHAHGGCPAIAKMRLRGRSWTAAEKLAFERRAYGI